MDESSINRNAAAQLDPDRVSVARWFAGYAAGLAATLGLTVWLAAGHDWQTGTWTAAGMSLSERWSAFLEAFARAGPGVKLLGFAVYTSLCTTFFPMPTGGIVAALATRQVALAGGLDAPTIVVAAVTTLMVAAVGAAGSTVANLNDYHLFTWMLRHHRVSRVRDTQTYRKAAAWFSRCPFFLLVVFNLVPIPVDLVRLLATTYRYPRGRFAAANYIGRFIRYAVIAFVTYWWNLGWVAVASLLAVAVAMGLARLARRTRS